MPDKKNPAVQEAGQKGGERERELVNEGKNMENEFGQRETNMQGKDRERNWMESEEEMNDENE